MANESEVQIFPRIRQDIIISKQIDNSGENTSYVIKDPLNERYFRFQEIEFYIISQLDGSNSHVSIIELIHSQFDITISESELKDFLDGLLRTSLLENSDPGSKTHPRKKIIKGDILYLRFKLFNPENLFRWLLPRTRIFFTAGFILFSISLLLIATLVTFGHWREIITDFKNTFHWGTILTAWLVILVVVTLHEFAHGMTCSYFGGKVKEIGFLLIYFQPAFYCNVSDAWLFPEKHKRLWVTFAGAYFEVFIWAIATLIWRLTEPGTNIHYFALIITCTSAIKSFFNLNPLIKLDGYYLLSDWLNIPNLRKKAFHYLNNSVRSIWSKSATALLKPDRKNRNLLISYAFLSAIYSYTLLYKTATWFGGFMVTRFQAWGFIIFMTCLIIYFRYPLKNHLVSLKTYIQNMQIKTFFKRGKFKIIMIITTILLLMSVIKKELRISGSFTIIPVQIAKIHAPAEGIIDSIYVKEGESVKKNSMIAKLVDSDYRLELNKINAEIEAANAKLHLSKSGPRNEEIELARIMVTKAKDQAYFANINEQRSKFLLTNQVISPKEYEQSLEDRSKSESEFREMKERLNLLLTGNRPEEIQWLQADIRRLTTQKKYLEKKISELTLVCPINGTVITKKTNEKIGENVKKGDLLLEINQINYLMAEIQIPEKEIGDIKQGQKITLKARAFPGQTFTGKVYSISPVVEKLNEWQNDHYLIVRSYIPNPGLSLKPLMTGNAKIHCEKHSILSIVFRRFVRYIRVEFWSLW
ncbi:MAG: efflux RND transporter periplasmic adaptor subunit [Bacteroidetes bacterium]|nr:efflux RND transporter periplasmic adaptor subunit [Bacteroidota bacterium]